MQRYDIVMRIGNEYQKSNIEGGEFSYVQAAGSKKKLVELLGYTPDHFKVDIRFENKERGVVVLVETKPDFIEEDEEHDRHDVRHKAHHLHLRVVRTCGHAHRIAGVNDVGDSP